MSRWARAAGAAITALWMTAAVLPGAAGAAPPPGSRRAAPPGYAQILDAFLVQVPRAGGGTTTRFDYLGFWRQPGEEGRMDLLRKQFESVDPEALSDSARTAWAINAYNFLVIDQVMQHLVGVAGDTLDSISRIGPRPLAVFDEPLITVAGTTYSLNSFERHFLFRDVDRSSGTVPPGLDPRLHFALVCAARGCPPLRPAPYPVGNLDEALDAAVRGALRNPDQLRRDGDTLHLSKIFDWYAVDFGGQPGIRAFLARYAPDPVREALAGGKIAHITADIDWDWSLNRP